MMFGCPFGLMNRGGDIDEIKHANLVGVRYAALLGQVPEWCPWTLGSNRFMSLMRLSRGFPDVTAPLIQVCEFITSTWLNLHTR